MNNKKSNSIEELLENYVNKNYTQYGIFMHHNASDMITSMYEELFFPRTEMHNISLFDDTGSIIGCKLTVNYIKRGKVIYEIKKRDYDSFRPWLENYFNTLACVKPDNRKYVWYVRSQGYIIPYEKLSQEELENLMSIISVRIETISSRKWYVLGRGDVEIFEKYIR